MGAFSWDGLAISFILGYGITILGFYIFAKRHKETLPLLRASEVGIIITAILMVFVELVNSLGPNGAQGVGGLLFIILFPICVLLISPAIPLAVLTSESIRSWVRVVGAIGVLIISSVIVYGASFAWTGWVFPAPTVKTEIVTTPDTSASISVCDSLGQTYSQDMANIAGALKNIMENYHLDATNGALTQLDYRCTVGSFQGIQRTYGFYFPTTATDGIGYAWNDNGGTVPDQYTATPPIAQGFETEIPPWTIGSSEVVNEFMSTGGLEYLKTALNGNSSISLYVSLNVYNGAPVWNVNIQGSSLNKSYNAKTGILCSNVTCSAN